MSGSTTNGNGTTTTQLDPQIKQDWTGVFNQAQQDSSKLGKMDVPTQSVAALSGDQKQADNLLGNSVGAANQDLNQASNLAFKAGHTNADNINTPDLGNAQGYSADQLGNAQGYSAATINPNNKDYVDTNNLSQVNLNGYLNPYQDNVINSTISDANRARQIQMQSDKASAIDAHAFGGSRDDVARSLTNDAYQRNLDSTLANLNSQGYTQATQNAETDLGRQLQAGTTNAGTDLTLQQANQGANNAARQFGASANNQFGLADQSAVDAAKQFGASANNTFALQDAANKLAAKQSNQSADLTSNAQQLQAAQTLGSLGQATQGAALTDVNALNSQGAINQTQAQNVLNAGTANQTAQRNALLQTLQTAESPFQIMPSTGQGGTSSTNSSGKGIGI